MQRVEARIGMWIRSFKWQAALSAPEAKTSDGRWYRTGSCVRFCCQHRLGIDGRSVKLAGNKNRDKYRYMMFQLHDLRMSAHTSCGDEKAVIFAGC